MVRERQSTYRHLRVHRYIGMYPREQPHGNKIPQEQQKKPTNYIRTFRETMDKIRQGVKDAQPLKVYNDKMNSASMLEGPRNLRQVRTMKYTEKKKAGKESGKTERLNKIADHIQHVQSMLHSHPFVQHVATSKDKAPTIILYTDEQFIDFKKSCFSDALAKNSIIGTDRTFNLGPLHVTTTVFKQQKVVRNSSDEHPIFFGPMCLHGNSDFQTYSIF